MPSGARLAVLAYVAAAEPGQTRRWHVMLAKTLAKNLEIVLDLRLARLARLASFASYTILMTV
jgi:hypothetical protein